MPRKLWNASINAGVTLFIGIVVLSNLCPLISHLTEFPLWKLRCFAAIPFLLVFGGQVWMIYCGAFRDGDWWIEEEPRRRWRRRY